MSRSSPPQPSAAVPLGRRFLVIAAIAALLTALLPASFAFGEDTTESQDEQQTQIESDETESDDTESDDTETDSDDTDSDETETESDDSESDDSESDDSESDDSESEEGAAFTTARHDDEQETSEQRVDWQGNGSENLPCDGDTHWILTPGGDTTISDATLHVDGQTHSGTKMGNGAIHFFSGAETESSAEGAFATFEGTGEGNYVLTISSCEGEEAEGDTDDAEFTAASVVCVEGSADEASFELTGSFEDGETVTIELTDGTNATVTNVTFTGGSASGTIDWPAGATAGATLQLNALSNGQVVDSTTVTDDCTTQEGGDVGGDEQQNGTTPPPPGPEATVSVVDAQFVCVDVNTVLEFTAETENNDADSVTLTLRDAEGAVVASTTETLVDAKAMGTLTVPADEEDFSFEAVAGEATTVGTASVPASLNCDEVLGVIIQPDDEAEDDEGAAPAGPDEAQPAPTGGDDQVAAVQEELPRTGLNSAILLMLAAALGAAGVLILRLTPRGTAS